MNQRLGSEFFTRPLRCKSAAHRYPSNPESNPLHLRFPKSPCETRCKSACLPTQHQFQCTFNRVHLAHFLMVTNRAVITLTLRESSNHSPLRFRKEMYRLCPSAFCRNPIETITELIKERCSNVTAESGSWVFQIEVFSTSHGRISYFQKIWYI
jgi:hypothetical protein